MRSLPEVLYISYDGLTDQLGQSQILPYLQGLSAKGYRITIVSCEKREAYEKHSETVLQIVAGAEITWHYTFYSHKIPVLSAIRNTIRLKALCKKACVNGNIKIIHCRSYLAALIGLRLKRFYGCRLIFDMRGFWPDERVDGGLWNLKNPVFKTIYHYFKKQEKLLIKNADQVVTLTQKAKELISGWKIMPAGEHHISVIPCCTDIHHFNYANISDESKEELRRQFGIAHNALVLTYIGSTGTWYMLAEMLDFYALLLKSFPQSRFLFITNENAAAIKDLAHQKKTDTSGIIITSASRRDVPLLLSIADLSIFFIRPSFSKQASSPTKLAELMSMGIPVITNTGVGDVDSIINESSGGILINDFSCKAYEEAIRSIPGLLKINKPAARAYAVSHFSLEKGIDAYNAIYKTLLTGD